MFQLCSVILIEGNIHAAVTFSMYMYVFILAQCKCTCLYLLLFILMYLLCARGFIYYNIDELRRVITFCIP